jgi:hypothetical protein
LFRIGDCIREKYAIRNTFLNHNPLKAMTKYQILYWHDIPLQVKAQEGRTRASKPLSDRFQVAVDNASMEAGLTGTDQYLDLMQWGEPQERDGSPDEVVAALVAELEAQYPRIDWRKTADSVRSDQ